MTQTTHPSKEIVRAHMQRRAQERTPPPTPEQIRRQLGWHMLPNNNQQRTADQY